MVWSRAEGTLPAEAQVNGTILVLPRVGLGDNGTYTCVGEDLVGADKRNINLVVRGVNLL